MSKVKVIVITGASSGLGLSLSKKFIDSGATVFGLTKTKKHWKNAQERIDNPSRFQLFQVDVTNESKIRNFFSTTIKKTLSLDLVINNAGYGGTLSTVDQLELSEFEQHVNQNLYSAFLTSKYSLPIFRKQGRGYIINISSMAGKRAVPKLAAYSASKFAVVALSQCIAKENTDFDFKCIAVCPGGMNTFMRASLFSQEDAEKQQTTEFVAGVILKIFQGLILVDSGGDVIVRHGQVITNPCPQA